MINRTAFYGLALFTAVLQTCFGFFAGFVKGFSPYLHIFGKLAGATSIATWIWLSVLMHYNRRPLSTHPFARSLAHFTSFIILTGIWTALAIMIASQMAYECSVHDLWCAVGCFSSALGFLTSIFSAIAATLVYQAAMTSGAGLEVNVAQASRRATDIDL
ncbi:hypothetical protein FA13DRAFT_229971 [Coprinellus micaceus]|uniref:MARVEL domain-containing protein n=1 Tax=Coprinellus micaceus TaxID=71717 RepID=A0A4Y7TFB5_COPMI|nr:hypothetical protein FA13DRAFT_229971 [Coprinellus micaceus]